MNNGSYGIVRMSDVEISDIDIYYTFMNDRGNGGNTITARKLDSSKVITKVRDENGEDLKGLYNIKLPADIFNQLGVYNILLTPRGVRTKIVDNGILATRPDIRGIVIDLNNPEFDEDRGKIINGYLDGYRIEYKNRKNIYRIVTSSNKCEPVNDMSLSSNQKQVRYRFNELSSLLFLTLTPSGSSDIKLNTSSYLGEVGDDITIYNTHFDPVMVEVELVDTTLETIKHGLFGNQIETKDGKLTIFTADEEQMPFKEYNLFVVKNEFDEEMLRVKMGVDVSDTENFDITLENESQN